MAKDLVVKSRFTILDDFSSKFNRMMNVAQSRFEKTSGTFGRMKNLLANNEDRLKQVAKTSAVAGLAIVGGLGYAVKEAVAFEKAMAGVAKYANVDIGSEAFTKLGDDAKELSVTLGIAVQDTADLMQNLAGGGVAIQDLKEVTEIAGKMGVAFDISGDMAGEAFVKTKNALNLTIAETSAVMDSINQLGNAYAANSDQILEFMALGGAGVANSLKAGGDEVAAFGSRLISIGNSASASATIMEAFTRTVNKNKNLSKIFDSAGGGAKGMFAVLEKGSKLSGAAQKKYFSKFGNYGLAIQNLASNTDALKESIDLASDATGRAGSVNKEFDNVNSTSAARLARLKAQFDALVISVGEALLPMLISLADEIEPIIKSTSKWIKENKDSVITIAKVTAIVGGALLVLSALSTIMLGVSSVFKIASAAVKVFNFIMALNPALLFVSAIILLIGYMYIAIDNFKTFGSVMLTLLGPIGILANAFMLMFDYWDAIVESFKSDGIIGGIKKIGAFLLDLVLYPLQQALNLISKIPGMGKISGNARDVINDIRKSMGAIDVGGELKTTSTSVVKNSPVTGVNNKSEVVLKIDDGSGVKTKDITNGSFTFNAIPAVSSTLK